MLLEKQSHISPYRGLPIEVANSWEASSIISSETVTLFYFNWDTLTEDSWQVAWTIVVWKLSIGQIQDSIWSWLWSYWNTSLTITSTALTLEWFSTITTFEAVDSLSLKQKLKSVTNNLSDWEYVIDYSKWVIYWKKADNSTSVTVWYKTKTSLSSWIKYNIVNVRDNAILTNAYVPWTVISWAENYNQLIIYLLLDMWSLTSVEMIVEFSSDWVTYYQETFGSISSWTQTLTSWENKIITTWNYRYTTPINDKYIRISIKGTWTVTSSSAKISAILWNS